MRSVLELAASTSSVVAVVVVVDDEVAEQPAVAVALFTTVTV